MLRCRQQQQPEVVTYSALPSLLMDHLLSYIQIWNSRVKSYRIIMPWTLFLLPMRQHKRLHQDRRHHLCRSAAVKMAVFPSLLIDHYLLASTLIWNSHAKRYRTIIITIMTPWILYRLPHQGRRHHHHQLSGSVIKMAAVPLFKQKPCVSPRMWTPKKVRQVMPCLVGLNRHHLLRGRFEFMLEKHDDDDDDDAPLLQNNMQF
mmetsp:Transcript_16688/g.40683  ORF Transcript_16688/g.40683 Transcript_16688/m.40683 type:complete len:203 (-) Transcript_16688:128-736(-)